MAGRVAPRAPQPGNRESGAHGVTRPTREVPFVSIRVHSWFVFYLAGIKFNDGLFISDRLDVGARWDAHDDSFKSIFVQ